MDHRSQVELPYLHLFFGFTMLMYVASFMLKFDNKKRAEVLYHTRLTANQIEDEIRELREERAAVAKELEEVNAALRGK